MLTLTRRHVLLVLLSQVLKPVLLLLLLLLRLFDDLALLLESQLNDLPERCALKPGAPILHQGVVVLAGDTEAVGVPLRLLSIDLLQRRLLVAVL